MQSNDIALLPLSIVLATLWVSLGVVQSFADFPAATTLEGAEQVVPLGPAASQIAIKQLGTNGVGFFGVNSAHPFENPTPLSNFLQLLAILLLPAALPFTFGRMTGRPRDGRVLFGVMCIVYLGAIFCTGKLFAAWSGLDAQIAGWLWFTVLFANFAEALAEGRGKAQAGALRALRTDTPARRLLDGREERVSSSVLRTGDLVVCEAGEPIPADGEVVEGIASVDESAITGESAPVMRESDGDRSAVTGGTRVLSDRIVIRGMDRLVRRNVLATSGKAVEAVGDIDVLLLDKTGTITLGNRMATDFLPARGVTAAELAAEAGVDDFGQDVRFGNIWIKDRSPE